MGSSFGVISQTGNNIQTEGLIFYVDPAYKKSWSGPESSNTNTLVPNSTLSGSINNDTSGSYGQYNSFNFDGTDDSINLNPLTELNINVGSISMWWKPVDATPSSANCLLSVASTTVTNDYFAMYNLSDGKFYAQLKDNNLNNWILQTDAAAFSDNTWHHIVITQNGTEPELYVNGAKPAQTFTTSTNKTKWWDDITIEQVNIGKLTWSGGTSGLSTGDVGPINIYNRALSAGDILQNYNAQKDRFGL
jgi:hypothetical protein